MDSQVVRDSLGLQEPLTITDVCTVLDGGTVCVSLADAAGRESWLCFDRRMDSRNHGWLYIGASHPDAPQAELVPLGSDLQGEVLGRLRAAMARDGPNGWAGYWPLVDAVQRLRELTWDAKAGL